MTPVQAHLIADFWHQIQRRIKLIRENGHLPCPLDVEDNRDFELEDAYDAIHPLLICISKPQLYAGVSSLPEMQGSFVAENAHQAISIQFNPTESMFGNPSLLESDAIKQLLRQVEAEDAKLAGMLTIPVAIPVAPRIGADIWNDDYVPRWILPNPSIPSSSDSGPLTRASKSMSRSTTRQKQVRSPQGKIPVPPSGRKRVSPDDVFSGDALKILSLLMAFHMNSSGQKELEPIGKQDEIAEMLGGRKEQWDQARVSVAMKELMADVKGFPNDRGMTRYKKLCNTVRIVEELKRLDLRSLVTRLKIHDVAGCMERFSSDRREDLH